MFPSLQHLCADATITTLTEDAIDTSEIPTEASAFVNLPPSLFTGLEGDDGELGIAFTFYDRATFFPIRGIVGGNTVVGSPVIGAAITLVDVPFLNSSEPIIIQLQLNQDEQEVHSVIETT